MIHARLGKGMSAALVLLTLAVSGNAYNQLHCCNDPSYGLSHWEVAQIPVRSNTANLPSNITPTQFLNALQNAVNTWNGAGANISFHNYGSIGTEPCSPTGFTDCTAPFGPCYPTYVDVVGFTNSWPLLTPPVVEAGAWIDIDLIGASEFDTCQHGSGKTLAYSVALNPLAPLSVNPGTNEADLESLILHELGHILGLADVDDLGSVMYKKILIGDVLHRSLQPDDIAGVRAIYPPPVTPKGACCNPRGTCADGYTAFACQSTGGTYKGDGTTCATVSCGGSTGPRPVPSLTGWGIAALIALLLVSGAFAVAPRKGLFPAR